MKHEKTFAAIKKLQEVEIELHRLKNLLEIANKASDAKREWVGLTSVDWNDFNAVKGGDPHYVAQWTEAKLKEKNNA